MLKGLLGLSTSAKLIEDFGSELENNLAGPLFMDHLLFNEQIIKNQFSILMTHDHEHTSSITFGGIPDFVTTTNNAQLY